MVLESLASVDEDNGHFIVELAAEFDVCVHINFTPRECALARELAEAFFHYFAQMAALTRVNDDAVRRWHAGGILARELEVFQK